MDMRGGRLRRAVGRWRRGIDRSPVRIGPGGGARGHPSLVVAAVVVLAMVGSGAGLAVHGATAAPNGRGRAHAGSVHRELNPVNGNDSFASTRGQGYEHALGAARLQAAQIPVAPGSAQKPVASTTWASLGPKPINKSFYGTLNSGRVTGFCKPWNPCCSLSRTDAG